MIDLKASELMKKVLTIGVGAFFLTEESLKNLIADFKLPKELLNAILESTEKTKSEFLQLLAKEVMRPVAEKIDITHIVESILKKNDVIIKVQFQQKSK